MNSLPKLIIHGLGDLGIDVIQSLNTFIAPLQNHLISPNQKGVSSTAKLVFSTSILDNSSRRLRQTAKTNTIQGKLEEGVSLSSHLSRKLTYYYGHPSGAKQKCWMPIDAPRLDFFLADITDPRIFQWLSKILAIQKPPNTLRILLIVSPHPKKKFTIVFPNNQEFDCVLHMPILVNTKTRTKKNIQQSILLETVQILIQLLVTLIYTGEINIDFQDIYNLLKQGSDGIILSRSVTIQKNTKKIPNPFKNYYLPVSPDTILYSILSFIDFNGSLGSINHHIRQYQQVFAKHIDLKWSVTLRPYVPKKPSSSHLLVIGVT